MNTEDRPATRDSDSPYPREGLELVVPEEEPVRARTQKLIDENRRLLEVNAALRGLLAHPRRLPGWLARLVGR